MESLEVSRDNFKLSKERGGREAPRSSYILTVGGKESLFYRTRKDGKRPQGPRIQNAEDEERLHPRMIFAPLKTPSQVFVNNQCS